MSSPRNFEVRVRDYLSIKRQLFSLLKYEKIFYDLAHTQLSEEAYTQPDKGLLSLLGT